ncbi:MAG: NFACT family protein [Clostridia bacterium]|nr:NFACT family protein [Clostridia bacterium]
MSFDGLLMHQLINELESKLVGGRIDKIHQPEKDELTIQIRNQSTHYNLFISVDASIPYFTLTSQKKENPGTPPMFCMLLRKHLVGGKILSISQHDFERVLIIEIESRNELGDFEAKKLYVEIMGKHSNIILTKADDAIVESIKRITPDMSRVRSVLPGLRYELIPTTKKMPDENWLGLLKDMKETTLLYKAIYGSLQGFSPLISNYLLRKIGVPNDLTLEKTDPDTLIRLKNAVDALNVQVLASQSKGYVFNDKDSNHRYFYFLEDAYDEMEPTRYEFISEAIDAFYAQSNKNLKIHQRTVDLKKNIAQRIERSRTKLGKLELELYNAENSDHYKICGELILANIHNMVKGTNSIDAMNYYMDPPETVTIDLDVRLDPSQNAQKYFKKYNKAKIALRELKIQIHETLNEIEYLENILTHLNNSEDSKTIDEIREELAEQGIIKNRNIVKSKKSNKKQDFKHFYSTGGFEILVGKSNTQNDQLTTKIASNKDVWLHTKTIPGSHVIIRTEGQEVDATSLEEAALIAAYYSKARESSNVPVDYTMVKHVTKPNGAKPGMVIYVQYKTIFVTPDYEKVKTLSRKE